MTLYKGTEQCRCGGSYSRIPSQWKRHILTNLHRRWQISYVMSLPDIEWVQDWIEEDLESEKQFEQKYFLQNKKKIQFQQYQQLHRFIPVANGLLVARMREHVVCVIARSKFVDLQLLIDRQLEQVSIFPQAVCVWGSLCVMYVCGLVCGLSQWCVVCMSYELCVQRCR